MCLGDHGAEVIKIEHPEHGDELRHHKPPHIECDSPYFLSLNRNKKSIGLDLSGEEGRRVAHDLIAKSDVLVENFRTGVMDRHGLGYADLAERYPRLIYCSISGYGREGSLRARAAYDPLVQAESGLMATNGSAESGPLRTGLAFTDMSTGLHAAQAIIAALFARERTGRGQFIEVPLFDVAVASLSHYGLRYLMDGAVLPRVGNGSNAAQPIGLFPAGDGKLMQITCAGERPYRTLVTDVLQRPDLAEDPRFANNSARIEHAEELRQILLDIFATADRETWVARMLEAGVPGGPVNEIDEALEAPIVAERDLVERIPHSQAGEVPNLRSPVRMSETPVRKPLGAPMLAEHTDAILHDVAGYDNARIAALREGGVVR
jgi:crotonobetainyl-CoA:carnitine CoA-transferase CaiB-like acyl-CoA transferase